ncbi:holo-ACP synthase [Ancrocorticia populi]|uniref:holo-ACP synthase AcpS n=1 Tax=Ancrocorticia populi TaxID=2175228 RepID=UPI001A9C8CA4|nr:holo-ACP synthase [Ancrocorticia populi]
MIAGIGTDIVDLRSFREQLAQPGSQFDRVFTGRERRAAAERARDHAVPGTSGDAAPHLAARWAAKEAFVKAWSAGIYGRPPVVGEESVWALIEVVADKWNRPCISLYGDVLTAVAQSLGPVATHVSLSHDGDFATATVVIEYAD